ncbi:hypothetical protein M378DRAFT_849270 [Amanita muscaria Koide BX008]|uniref:Uncharacterized protein n=1 Tax=Amanita muscaria (strain Koide BX008) TaxID=946122 RepID=A0A0C2WJI3_AMAMK|nr:hypothetical protein M378DRAFT_849270 [Amanita muscaria Koide BX008]
MWRCLATNQSPYITLAPSHLFPSFLSAGRMRTFVILFLTLFATVALSVPIVQIPQDHGLAARGSDSVASSPFRIGIRLPRDQQSRTRFLPTYGYGRIGRRADE